MTPPPYRRYRDAWVRRMRQEPGLSTVVQAVLEALVDHPQKRRGNTFVFKRDDLAAYLHYHSKTVQKALSDAVASGWLVRHGGAYNGQPQQWHRSTPWDPCHYWPNCCAQCRAATRGVVDSPSLPPTGSPWVRDSARPSIYGTSPVARTTEDLVDSVLDRMFAFETLATVASEIAYPEAVAA